MIDRNWTKPIQDAWINELVTLLQIRSIAAPHNLAGCTKTEIGEIQKQFTSDLPIAYRTFLEIMGRGAGRFFVGTDIYYPEIIGITRDAIELVAEDRNEISLPENAIVFAMHQGYQFMFLVADGVPNPSVQSYMEQSGAFEIRSNSFSQFLLNAAKDEW